MDESSLRRRLREIEASLSSIRSAQSTLSGLSSAGHRLTASATGVQSAAHALVAGSSTGVDAAIAAQMTTVATGGSHFASAVDRAHGELGLAVGKLSAEAAWCHSELRRLEAERAAAARARR